MSARPKRSAAIAMLRIAGYHDDKAAFVRLYTSARVSYAQASETFAEGKRARAAGVACSCMDCRGVA